MVVDVPIVGPVGSVLDEMLALLDESKDSPDVDALNRWWQRQRLARPSGMRHEKSQAGGLMKPQRWSEACALPPMAMRTSPRT